MSEGGYPAGGRDDGTVNTIGSGTFVASVKRQSYANRTTAATSVGGVARTKLGQ